MGSPKSEPDLRLIGWIKGPDGNWHKPPSKAVQNLILQSAVELPPKVTGASTMEERLNKTEKRFLERLRRLYYPPAYYLGIQEITIRLGFDLRYTPDFHVCRFESGSLYFYEVKGGFEREDAAIKIKMAAAKFPFWQFVKAVWKDGVWTETIVRP